MSILGRWICDKCGCDDISDLVMNCPKCSKPRLMESAPPSKPTLVFMLGPTNVGKSTILRKAAELHGGVGLVEVGKLMRAKYLEPTSPHYQPDYFKGQGAPMHTAKEAWQMMLDGIAAHEAAKKTWVLIDGQPRDFIQCYDSMKLPYDKVYVNLYAPLPTRKERAAKRDPVGSDAYKLAERRMLGDVPVIYEILSLLMIHRQPMLSFSTLVDRPELVILERLTNRGRYEPQYLTVTDSEIMQHFEPGTPEHAAASELLADRAEEGVAMDQDGPAG